MGGGTPRASTANRATPQSPAPRPDRPRLSPFRHSCALLPSFLRRQEPTPLTLPPLLRPSSRHSCAPLPSFLRRQEPPNKPPPLPNSSPTYDEKGAQIPNSSLPPLRGEVRWGVERHEPAPPIAPRPNRPRLSPFRHSCAGRNPRLSPFRHSCAPLPSFLRRQEPTPPLLRHPCTPPPSFLRLLPSFLRRQERRKEAGQTRTDPEQT